VIGAALDWLRHVGRRRAMSADLVTGKRGEDLAHRYLRRQGYKIVARNYRLASGDAEADLIARDGADLVIVEVKTRQTDDYGPPDRAIGPEKLRHILRVAREYARRTETPLGRVRIDAVTVVLRSPPEIALFRGVLRFPG
jgi:putative endonuclease